MTTNARRLLVLAGIAALLAIGAAGGVLWQARRDAARAVTTARDLYHCPMHPTVVSDRPGDCPICGMRLVRASIAPPAGSPVADEGAVEGQAGVTIGARKQQLINVRTVAASRGPFVRTLRAVGRVVPDETRLHHLHTKVGGWVEMLHLTATGARVDQGAPLLDLYSPELVASQEEYLLALRSRRDLGQEALPEVARRADDLVQSARRRLLLFDMTPQQIEELETRGEPRRTVTVFSPISGYVIARNVTHGEKISPDTALFDIANLARIWVMASVYEYELPFVQPGQAATTTLASLPGEPLSGRVDIIYPTLDEATRTAQVRLEFDNPRLQLKPGMYAEVQIRSDLGARLSIPASAVVESGTRSIVFVEQGEGYFAPREVRIGLRLPDTMEVIEGLSEGEKVVASGTFFVDSESKLKAALEAAASGQTAPPAGGHAHPSGSAAPAPAAPPGPPKP